MAIPMETTIQNLKKLDNVNYEHISFIISKLVDENVYASDDEVMATFEQINGRYSETFKALAQ